jgi:hypothetical protein
MVHRKEVPNESLKHMRHNGVSNKFQTELDLGACHQLYGTLSVLRIPITCQSDTTPSQDSILAYLFALYSDNTMDYTKAPTSSRKISSSMLYVFYMF